MFVTNRKNSLGFVLIEALVAVLIVALGIMALAKLEAMVVSAAGESRARSEAVTLARAKTDELRNAIIKSQVVAISENSATVTGQANTYTLSWDVRQDFSPTQLSPDQHLIVVKVTWTDAAGNARQVNLNTLIAWDDSIAEVKLTTFTGTNLITPTGSAKRGDGKYTGGGVTTDTQNGRARLLDTGTGKTILYLDPGSNNVAQQFTTISGKVYFDQNQLSKIPASTDVRVRLSSEGECIYNNDTLVAAGSDYKYFTYVCYVGPGWYGNIAVTIDSDVNGSASTPTICLGDPVFNSGISNSTSTSAHPIESATRSYRGFYHDTVGQIYLSRGVLGGSAYPFDGIPKPSSFPLFYPSVTAGDTNDFFNHNFLITNVSGQGSCKSKMQLGGSPGTEFTRNAGKYYCLSPDDDTVHADACPTVWPGYESEVGSGGSINWLLTVVNSGSGTGTVASTPTGINCGSSCSASFASGTSVTLNPTAGTNSIFAGWSGDCAGTASCIVDMSAARNVTATFNTAAATQFNLAVVMAGNGTGSVTSSPTGVSCGSVCNFNFSANSSVTLTATASSGTFTGWSGGGCSGAGACTVTMDQAHTVIATFQSAATPYALTVAKSGSGTGTVSSSPSGIDCGATCSASFNAGTSVTLTAAAGTNNVFAGWSGACTGTAASCTVTMSAVQNVTAQFSPSTCSTPVSGTAHDKQGQVAVTSPSGVGSCSMNSTNSTGYSCSLTTAPGTQVTLTNSRTGGQAYSYSLNVMANCAAQTNVNFPP